MERFINHFEEMDNLAIGLILIGVGALVGLILKFILFKLLSFYNRLTNPFLLISITKHLSSPLSIFLPLLFASLAATLSPLEESLQATIKRVFELLNIAVFGWILIKLTYVAQDMIQNNYQLSKADNIRERKLITQLAFLKKLAILVIGFVTVSLILLSFDPVRRLGTGLLTSAGIAGIVIGLAAQQSIANLLAGLQLAISQPIRIDDVLVLEGEFGRVEEITLTYVVLRIWDQRRMVFPLKYFIEKPFQNWTRTSAEILGTVYLYTDYTILVDELRHELKRILAGTDLWDGKVAGLQVTDSKERTLELRVLVSAVSSGIAWDLRCLVREKLVTFIQKNYPSALPKIRTELVGEYNFQK